MAKANGHSPEDYEPEPSSDDIAALTHSGLREITRDLRERALQLRIRFEATHAALLEALATDDYVTLRDMIEAERAIIDEQAALMKEHTARAPWRRHT